MYSHASYIYPSFDPEFTISLSFVKEVNFVMDIFHTKVAEVEQKDFSLDSDRQNSPNLYLDLYELDQIYEEIPEGTEYEQYDNIDKTMKQRQEINDTESKIMPKKVRDSKCISTIVCVSILVILAVIISSLIILVRKAPGTSEKRDSQEMTVSPQALNESKTIMNNNSEILTSTTPLKGSDKLTSEQSECYFENMFEFFQPKFTSANMTDLDSFVSLKFNISLVQIVESNIPTVFQNWTHSKDHSGWLKTLRQSASRETRHIYYYTELVSTIIFRVDFLTSALYRDVLFTHIPLIYVDCRNDVYIGENSFSIVAQLHVLEKVNHIKYLYCDTVELIWPLYVKRVVITLPFTGFFQRQTHTDFKPINGSVSITRDFFHRTLSQKEMATRCHKL